MKTKEDLICDVLEALEKVNEYKSLYLAVLKNTGDKKQAIEAVKWVVKMEEKNGK